MNINLFLVLSGIISIIVSCVLIDGFISYRTSGKYAKDEYPIAITIMKAICFISFALFVPKFIEAFNTYLNLTAQSIEQEGSLILTQLSYLSLYLGLTLLSFMVTFGLALTLFALMNKGRKLFVELANNDMYSLAFFGGLLVCISITFSSILMVILEYFIPYPEFPSYI